MRRLIIFGLALLISPFLAILAATLLCFNLIHVLNRFRQKRRDAKEGAPSGLASIVILNWNGKDLLAQGLPSVLEAVRSDGRPHEVMVVDNGSSDGSVQYLEAEFPSVRVLPLSSNLGFAEGNNAGVRSAKNDVVVLVNNDMVVHPGFLRPLLEGFSDNTFAVSSQIYHQDPAARREETGKTAAVFRRGMIRYGHSPVEAPPLPRRYYPAFWAGGGSSAFHRRRFLMLGGFQEVYSPAYVEDTDISYQAWKQGWETLFAPDSVVYHRHRASSKKRFSPLQLQILIQRNQLLFLWKNIRSWRLLVTHCCYLPWTCYRLARDNGLAMWRALPEAVLRMPKAQMAMLRFPYLEVRSDREIFEMFAMPGLYFREKALASESEKPSSTPSVPSAAVSRIGPSPRVLWITAYLPHLGRHAGAGRMFQLLTRLSDEYRITLLSFLEKEEEREFLPELALHCERVVALRRSPPRRWQLFAYEPFEEFRTPEMEEALQHLLEHHDFDLIQLEYTQMACYAHRAFGIPLLLTKHEVDFAACARRARFAPGALRKLHWFYRYLQVLDREVALLRRVNAAICMTDQDRNALLKFCASVPVHVINTGVDLAYFKPTDESPVQARLVFVGAFQHEPNVDAMVYFCRAVLPRIRAEIGACELAIVGSNPPPIIQDLEGIPGVQVTGFVHDIRPFMASSAVYVVPLRLGVGIRGKILEAWSMGMAVVATSVACAGLQHKNGENILVADSAELFAAHVAALVKNPEMRERLGSAGRQLVERCYGWERAAQQLNSLYRKHLKK